jgi:hypothetical protein
MRPPEGFCEHCGQRVTWSDRRGAYAMDDGTGSIICRPRGRDALGRAQLHNVRGEDDMAAEPGDT